MYMSVYLYMNTGRYTCRLVGGLAERSNLRRSVEDVLPGHGSSVLQTVVAVSATRSACLRSVAFDGSTF